MMKKIIVFALLVLALSSWGFLAHKTIHQIAIYQLPKSLGAFFYANKEYLVYNSVRPDVRRRDDKTEDTKHFIDIDAPVFGSNALADMPEDWEAAKAKYTEDTLRKYGTVCWEIVKIQGQLTEAFRQKKTDSVLFYAADLGHYIADAHVPLHTTINYDGQLTNQIGLHSLWETTIPEVHLADFKMFQGKKAKYIKDPQTEIWKSFRQSYAMLNEVIEAERLAAKDFAGTTKYKISERNGKKRYDYTGDFAKAYQKVLGQSVNDRLLESAQMVSNFWYTAWKDAGSPILPELTEAQKSSLKAEKAAWKSSQLVQLNLLDAKKK